MHTHIQYLKSSGVLPITLWMNMPSHYQDDLIGCLNQAPGVDLRVVYDGETPASRLQLGWHRGTRPYPHTLLGGCKALEAVRTATGSRDRIHIFNGIWAVPSFAAALLARLVRAGAPFFIYSEVPKPDAARSPLRRAIRSVWGGAVARSPRCGVLAVSRLAEDFYHELGFPRSRIYPFAYFRGAAECPQPGRPPALRLAFAGALERRKGLDLLLAALEPLWNRLPGLSLDLIGDGAEMPNLRAYLRLHPEARAHLRGAAASGEIPRLLADYDLLVLPSRFDGWGVVVNEALAAGLPAIVSDACGAADAIREGVNGYVFPAGDAAALRARILAFAACSRAQRAAMTEAAQAAAESLRPEEAARYLLDCIRHFLGGGAKPPAPWTLAHDSVLHR